MFTVELNIGFNRRDPRDRVNTMFKWGETAKDSNWDASPTVFAALCCPDPRLEVDETSEFNVFVVHCSACGCVHRRIALLTPGDLAVLDWYAG